MLRRRPSSVRARAESDVGPPSAPAAPSARPPVDSPSSSVPPSPTAEGVDLTEPAVPHPARSGAVAHTAASRPTGAGLARAARAGRASLVSPSAVAPPHGAPPSVRVGTLASSTALAPPRSTPLAPGAPISREAAENVLQYLVFHRSLLGEPDGGEPTALLERYLSLVEGLKEGVHVVISDPFQKATALLFELVLDQQFDPWEIDLGRFTQAYLERVRAEGEVDFQIAGRLLYMAWSILLLQSEEVLRHQQAAEPVSGDDPGAEVDLPVEDDGYLPLLDTPEAVDVTSTVLGTSEPPPLLEMVRHSESRPVSLLELVKAFGEAEADARQALKVQQLRERLREEQRAPPEVLVHGDVPEHDLADAWEAVERHPVGKPFGLLDLWNPLSGRDRLVALFLAMLFLARERSIDLEQEVLGSSPVMVVRTVEQRTPVAEEG